MSPTNLSLAGDNHIITGKGEFGKWHPGWGRENRWPFFTVYNAAEVHWREKGTRRSRPLFWYIIHIFVVSARVVFSPAVLEVVILYRTIYRAIFGRPLFSFFFSDILLKKRAFHFYEIKTSVLKLSKTCRPLSRELQKGFGYLLETKETLKPEKLHSFFYFYTITFQLKNE